MYCDLVKGLPLDLYSQQDFGKGEVVLSRHIQTDRLLLVLTGRLYDANLKKIYGAGELLQLVDFFAKDHYCDLTVAKFPSRVLLIPRQAVCDLLTKQAPMTWALSRMVAIERSAVPRRVL